jgi:N-acetylmuramoyl-L-alanine amidase
MDKLNTITIGALLSFIFTMGAVITYLAVPAQPEVQTYVLETKVESATKHVYIEPIELEDVKPEHVRPKKPKKVVVESKPAPKPLDNETYLLAQIISAEAKGEPYKGKLAVGNVVLNRVEDSGFPNTIKGVIFQKGQFSPVTDGSIHNKPTDGAIQAAKEVMNGAQVVSGNTLFFYNPNTSTSSWIFSRQVVEVIGRHAFAI